MKIFNLEFLLLKLRMLLNLLIPKKKGNYYFAQT